MIDFLTGNLTDHDSGISWKGKYGNKTYNELESRLFLANYSSFATPNQLSEDEFIVTHGICKKIESNYMGNYEFKTKENTKLVIVDPYRSSKLRIQDMDESSIVLGPTDDINGYFRKFVYYLNLNERKFIFILLIAYTDS